MQIAAQKRANDRGIFIESPIRDGGVLKPKPRTDRAALAGQLL
jgi:hypothetical protein